MKNYTIPHTAAEYTGRWEITDSYALTTACGSSLRLGFCGRFVLLAFDVNGCESAYPHIYISVDGGAMIECAVDRYIRVHADRDGEHEVRIVMKSSLETQNRWTEPAAKVVFLGALEAEAAPLEPDTRPIIEFVGDSITEGTSNYPHLTPIEGARWNENLVYTNDTCSGYAWQTAELLDMRGAFMGYGCLGVVNEGAGGIPPCPKSYPFIRGGVPYKGRANAVVINHGANDRPYSDEKFAEAYCELLDVVRAHNPGAKIISALSFTGAFSHILPDIIKQYNAENGTDIPYIDTTGWVPAEPVHPLYSSTRPAAKRLAEEIKKYL